MSPIRDLSLSLSLSLVLVALAVPLNAKTPVRAQVAGPVSIAKFGAVGDGKTNCTRAFRAAFASGNRDIYVPPGTYVVGPEKLTAPERVTIHGADSASVLRAAKGSGTLLVLGKECTLRNLSVECSAGKSPESEGITLCENAISGGKIYDERIRK